VSGSIGRTIYEPGADALVDLHVRLVGMSSAKVLTHETYPVIMQSKCEAEPSRGNRELLVVGVHASIVRCSDAV
jgi:hypothetical protein